MELARGRRTPRTEVRGRNSNGRTSAGRTMPKTQSEEPTVNPDPLLTETEAAKYLGYRPRTLAGWRYRGGGPVFVSTSKTSVRYRLSDLEAWIASRRRRSTSDCGLEMREPGLEGVGRAE